MYKKLLRTSKLFGLSPREFIQKHTSAKEMLAQLGATVIGSNECEITKGSLGAYAEYSSALRNCPDSVRL